MPLITDGFNPVSAGLKWNRRTKEAFFDVRSPSGRRVRRVFSFPSVEKAKAAFPAFRDDVKSGKYDGAERAGDHHRMLSTTVVGTAPVSGADSGSTFEEYTRDHWSSLHAKCSASTEKSNGVSLRSHLVPFFGSKPMAAIDEAACEDFTVYMKGKKKAPPTTNFALRLLRKILHHARRRKMVAELPESFHFVKEEQLKLELSPSEQEAFLAAFDDEKGFKKYLEDSQKRKGRVVRSSHFGFKERAFGGGRRYDSEAASIYFARFRDAKRLFVVALDTGFRENDLRLLRRPSVDLSKGVVSVVTQKTNKPAIVALSDRCLEAIVTAMSQSIASSEYIFTTSDGKPYSMSTIKRYFAIAKRIAGITRRCRLNDLRHTFASNLADEGCNTLTIRDALGHTTARMSERYAKPSDSALEAMRNALNRRSKPPGVTKTRHGRVA